MRKDSKESKLSSTDKATAGETEKIGDTVQEFQHLRGRRWWRRKDPSHDIEKGIFQNRRAGDSVEGGTQGAIIIS